jgi:hypothetical protein
MPVQRFYSIIKRRWSHYRDTSSHSHGHIRPSILIGGSIIIVILIAVNAYLFLTPPKEKEPDVPAGQTPAPSPTPEPKKPSFFLSWFAKPTNKPVPTPKVVPTKRPIYALPTGAQIYTFSHGKAVVGPKIQTATIDQLTPKVGEDQTVTISIKHDAPITGVAATLYTDTKDMTQTFTKVSGSETEGTWKTTWKLPESYDYRYLIQFHLKSPKGNFEGGLTFRQ